MDKEQADIILCEMLKLPDPRLVRCGRIKLETKMTNKQLVLLQSIWAREAAALAGLSYYTPEEIEAMRVNDEEHVARWEKELSARRAAGQLHDGLTKQ